MLRIPLLVLHPGRVAPRGATAFATEATPPGGSAIVQFSIDSGADGKSVSIQLTGLKRISPSRLPPDATSQCLATA